MKKQKKENYFTKGIRLDSSLIKRFKIEAIKEEMPMSKLLNKIVENYLNKKNG